MHSQGAGIQFFHGYTYSGHPLACAAALGALDTYAEEDLFDRPNQLAKPFEDAVHSFKGAPHVIDCRNIALMGAVELAPRPEAPGARGFEVFEKCWDKGVFIRAMGDIIAFCPPLISEQKHLDQMFGTVADVLKTVD
jgi:beta-alanine--pyruvate transaminase